MNEGASILMIEEISTWKPFVGLNEQKLQRLDPVTPYGRIRIDVQYVLCKNDKIGGLHIFYTIHLIIKILYI